MKTENDNLKIELIEIHLLKQKQNQRDKCFPCIFISIKYNAVL